MTIHIPTPLRTYTEGNAEVSILAGTVSEALEMLAASFPACAATSSAPTASCALSSMSTSTKTTSATSR